MCIVRSHMRTIEFLFATTSLGSADVLPLDIPRNYKYFFLLRGNSFNDDSKRGFGNLGGGFALTQKISFLQKKKTCGSFVLIMNSQILTYFTI